MGVSIKRGSTVMLMYIHNDGTAPSSYMQVFSQQGVHELAAAPWQSLRLC